MVGLRRCGRGKYTELQIALKWWCQGGFAALCQGKVNAQSCKSHWKVRESRNFNRKALRK